VVIVWQWQSASDEDWALAREAVILLLMALSQQLCHQGPFGALSPIQNLLTTELKNPDSRLSLLDLSAQILRKCSLQ
jgi:hypothetical protein